MPYLREISDKNHIKWVVYNWVPFVKKIKICNFTVVVNNKKSVL